MITMYLRSKKHRVSTNPFLCVNPKKLQEYKLSKPARKVYEYLFENRDVENKSCLSTADHAKLGYKTFYSVRKGLNELVEKKLIAPYIQGLYWVFVIESFTPYKPIDKPIESSTEESTPLFETSQNSFKDEFEKKKLNPDYWENFLVDHPNINSRSKFWQVLNLFLDENKMIYDNLERDISTKTDLIDKYQKVLLENKDEKMVLVNGEKVTHNHILNMKSDVEILKILKKSIGEVYRAIDGDKESIQDFPSAKSPLYKLDANGESISYLN